MRSSYLFTSESVSEGHPDKVADQISDAIVDLFLSKDPEARVACETMTTTNRVVLAGEIRGQGIMDEDGNWAPGVREEIESTVRGVVREIGYEQDGFHWDRLDFANHLHPQSAHIAQGVDAGEQQGRRRRRPGHHVRLRLRRNSRPDAGDALLQPQDPRARWPPTAIPAPRRSSSPTPRARSRFASKTASPSRRPRSSSRPSTPRATTEGEKQAELHAYVKDVVAKVMPAELLGNETVYHINPTGSFEIGGPDGDAGLTGRKIIVDTYGGAAPHGGGAFSRQGPDQGRPLGGLCRALPRQEHRRRGPRARCTIQLAYAIGVSKPLSLYVDTHGTGTVGRRAAREGDRPRSASSAA